MAVDDITETAPNTEHKPLPVPLLESTVYDFEQSSSSNFYDYDSEHEQSSSKMYDSEHEQFTIPIKSKIENMHLCNEMDEPPPVIIMDQDDYNSIEVENSNELLNEFSLDSEVSDCAIAYLKTLKRQSRNSSVKKQEFAKMYLLLFSSKVDDEVFMNALADSLHFENSTELKDFINLDKIEVRRRGRPMSKMADRQIMYDFWKEYSELSNDRRNGRHVVKVKPTKVDHAISDLVYGDDDVAKCETKGGEKLKAQKHIYTRTVKELHIKFLERHPNVSASSTLFYRCKPFYISPATPREMEGCLCSKCLNPHTLYNAVRRHIKDLPISLSDYLTTYFTCQKDGEINYHQVDCIHGECKNSCRIHNQSKSKDINWKKTVSYYQFESLKEYFCNREGKDVFFKRIARKNYDNIPLKDVYQLLMEKAEAYMLHRHSTLSDKVYWQKYLAGIRSPVMWMDYSMNIKMIEKNQVQSAHYSGKQQTLHDSLIDDDGSIKYIYHVSDDTNHDSVMTINIIEDCIIQHPELVKSGTLCLRSDNASTQYKSRFVFKALLDLAKKYSIEVIWFFGEAGHGRGLIDAMAWFGAKGPMRREIIQMDKWFENAHDMYTFLKEHFRNDKGKYYNFINFVDLAHIRQLGREERPVPGCQAARVLSFSSDGETVRKWRSMKEYLAEGKLDEEIEG